MFSVTIFPLKHRNYCLHNILFFPDCPQHMDNTTKAVLTLLWSFITQGKKRC